MHKKNVLPIHVFIFVVFSLSIISLVSSPGFAESQDNPIELRLAHIAPPMSHGVKFGYEPWAKSIEEATKGKVKVTIYPGGSLFKPREAISAVETGIADIVAFPLGYFAGRFNLTEVATLPMLVPSPSAEVYGRIAQELVETTPEMQREFSGMKLLFLHAGDPYFVVTGNNPVRTLDDLKGLKLRTIGKVPSAAVKKMGATPVMIPMPQLYDASAKGIIDGGLIFKTMILDLKLTEIFDYWLDVPMYCGFSAVAMNSDKWNSLPTDVQKAVMSVSGMKGAIFVSDHGFGVHVSDKLDAMVKKEGHKWERTEFEKEELLKLKNTVAKPIWEEWVNEMEKKGLPGQKVLDKALQLTEKNS